MYIYIYIYCRLYIQRILNSTRRQERQKGARRDARTPSNICLEADKPVSLIGTVCPRFFFLPFSIKIPNRTPRYHIPTGPFNEFTYTFAITVASRMTRHKPPPYYSIRKVKNYQIVHTGRGYGCLNDLMKTLAGIVALLLSIYSRHADATLYCQKITRNRRNVRTYIYVWTCVGRDRKRRENRCR